MVYHGLRNTDREVVREDSERLSRASISWSLHPNLHIAVNRRITIFKKIIIINRTVETWAPGNAGAAERVPPPIAGPPPPPPPPPPPLPPPPRPPPRPAPRDC